VRLETGASFSFLAAYSFPRSTCRSGLKGNWDVLAVFLRGTTLFDHRPRREFGGALIGVLQRLRFFRSARYLIPQQGKRVRQARRPHQPILGMGRRYLDGSDNPPKCRQGCNRRFPERTAASIKHYRAGFLPFVAAVRESREVAAQNPGDSPENAPPLLALPDNPSIAVLPSENMIGESRALITSRDLDCRRNHQPRVPRFQMAVSRSPAIRA